MFGTFFLITQYFQLVLGYTPLEAGLRLLPMSLVMMVLAPQTPKLVARFGANRVVPARPGLVAVGMAGLFSSGRDATRRTRCCRRRHGAGRRHGARPCRR